MDEGAVVVDGRGRFDTGEVGGNGFYYMGL